MLAQPFGTIGRTAALATLTLALAACGAEPPSPDRSPDARVVEAATDAPGPVDTDALLPTDDTAEPSDDVVVDSDAGDQDALDLDADDTDATGDTDATASDARADAAPPPPTCSKHVIVHWAVYDHLGSLAAGNGCWTSELTHQDPAWRICHPDGRIEHASGTHWVYDDTNPNNPLATDNTMITRCASGIGQGYVDMARRNGSWRRIDPGGVVRGYFAELYSSQSTVDDYYSIWAANPATASPMVNVSECSASTAHAAVLRICRAVASGRHIGIYHYNGAAPALDGATLAQVISALNACTR